MSIFKSKLDLETLCNFYYGNVLKNERNSKIIKSSLPESDITDEGLLRIAKNQEIYHLVTFNMMLITFALDGSIFIDPNYLHVQLLNELSKSIDKLEYDENALILDMYSNVENDMMYLCRFLAGYDKKERFLDEIIDYLISKYNTEKIFTVEENIFIRFSAMVACKAAINNASKFRIVK